MSVLIKNMEMPKGCIYANDNDQTEYCPLLNHDDVPFCQYIESEPEIAIGIGERPVYCPLSDVPEPCENTVSRQAAIDAMEESKRIYVDRRVIIGKMQDIVNNLPCAQQWIPGNERIPEGLIIVQFNDGDFDLLQFPTAYRRKDIVAWMPLPSAYEGK